MKTSPVRVESGLIRAASAGAVYAIAVFAIPARLVMGLVALARTQRPGGG